MNIVFMGTPDFAVSCLDRLLKEGHAVKAVFSQPDRPQGRGYKLIPTPVKALAEKNNIPVFQPVKLRDGRVARHIGKIAPDLIVVVAYGRILPKTILEIPKYGCVNVHASLLPKLRGAAPIQWSVIRGDTVTGVTTMYMAQGMDAGDIILRRETPVGPEETAGELFGRLAALGAECLSETVKLIEAGAAPREKQNEALVTYAPMIEKDMAYIDFSKTPVEICNLIRGLNPSPAAKMFFGGKLIKVLKGAPVSGCSGIQGELAGMVQDKGKTKFVIACKGGAVELLTVQPEGKRPMSGADFIRGMRNR